MTPQEIIFAKIEEVGKKVGLPQPVINSAKRLYTDNLKVRGGVPTSL